MNTQFRLTLKFSFSACTNTILEILFYFDCIHLSIISNSYNGEKKMRNFTDFTNYEIVIFWRIKTDILIKTVENLKDGVKQCLSKKYYN